MSKLATRKRNKKNQTRFQKMWQRVERLKSEIARRDTAMDDLAGRIREEILPAETRAATANVELLYRLLDLGQRKSWTNWQRQELELWIKDNMNIAAAANLLSDELRDAVACYDAFRMGVELDENDGRSPGEQMDAIIDEQEKLHAQAKQGARAEIESKREELIEAQLDHALGPRPTDDLAEDFSSEEQKAEIARRQQEYDQEREQLRIDLTEQFRETVDELFQDDNSDSAFDDYDDFDFNFDDEDLDQTFENKDSTFKLDNTTIQRMFRSAAAVLHPDREPDPDKRLLKQSLMAQLLSARKSGDVMTLLSLYQEHVENGQALSKADEKQLLGALQNQVTELEEQLQYYQPPSPLHDIAFDLYNPSKKKLDQNIQEHLHDIEEKAQMIRDCAHDMGSMNALKPLLALRFDRRRQLQREAYYHNFDD